MNWPSINRLSAIEPNSIVLNKLDLPGADLKAEGFRKALPDMDILSISAQTGDGLETLKSKLTQLLDDE